MKNNHAFIFYNSILAHFLPYENGKHKQRAIYINAFINAFNMIAY